MCCFTGCTMREENYRARRHQRDDARRTIDLRAGQPPRVHGRDRGRDAGGARRPRAAPRGAGRNAKATADAVIVLWMAGGMAQTETFDPKRYTPFAPGVKIKEVLSTFPTHSDRRRQHQVHAGARADRQRDGSRHGDPDVQRRRSRVHPALAASVSLAHRLHSAAADGDAAPRRGDLEDARTEEPGRAGVHRDRADGRGARRDRHAQGVSHRRASSAPSTGRS